MRDAGGVTHFKSASSAFSLRKSARGDLAPKYHKWYNTSNV